MNDDHREDVVARRCGPDSKVSTLTYYRVGGGTVVVQEDTHQVDGIGGVTWEGAFVLCRYLEMLSIQRMSGAYRMVELGAGTGLVGILAGLLGWTVTITDRFIDLATDNIKHATFPSSEVVAVELDWACRSSDALLADVVVGAEITCLRKQQAHLAATIVHVLQGSPGGVVLLTFDGAADDGAQSQYESEFLQLMRTEGFRHTTVFAGSVQWDGASARFRNLSLGDTPLELEVNAGHRVIAFFRGSAARTCQRCHRQFPATEPFSCAAVCRHHSGLFVCRRHPAELRCSVSGLGDSLGYYGNGEEGWAAEFWDCCGAEDRAAVGCCWSQHQGY